MVYGYWFVPAVGRMMWSPDQMDSKPSSSARLCESQQHLSVQRAGQVESEFHFTLLTMRWSPLSEPTSYSPPLP